MKRIFLYFFLIIITILIILNPDSTIKYALDSLNTCYEIIIPSLFPFFVCSSLLVHSGFCVLLANLAKPVMKPLFNINGAGAIAFVLGILSGYPLGAVTACELYSSSYLSKSETERLLSFCNNSGPLFILGSVAVSMYHSLKLGIIIYVSHIISSLCVGIIMRNYKKDLYMPPYIEPKTNVRSIGEVFSVSLNSSIQNILTVCGAVVFASVTGKLILDMLPLTGTVKSIVLGLFEFVCGISEISGLSLPLVEKLLLSSFIIGFSGLSVHLQVIGVISKYRLSLKPYFIGKGMQAFFSVLFSFLLWKVFYPNAHPVFMSYSYSAFTASFYSILSCVIVLVLCLVCVLMGLLHENTAR